MRNTARGAVWPGRFPGLEDRPVERGDLLRVAALPRSFMQEEGSRGNGRGRCRLVARQCEMARDVGKGDLLCTRPGTGGVADFGVGILGLSRLEEVIWR